MKDISLRKRESGIYRLTEGPQNCVRRTFTFEFVSSERRRAIRRYLLEIFPGVCRRRNNPENQGEAFDYCEQPDMGLVQLVFHTNALPGQRSFSVMNPWSGCSHSATALHVSAVKSFFGAAQAKRCEASLWCFRRAHTLCCTSSYFPKLAPQGLQDSSLGLF